ncbi:MAG: hypothetical protein LM571_02600 [Desulfurococcaceae archaeon]|nr:hypothetical protein [Desulfurococcaceae archaeon]
MSRPRLSIRLPRVGFIPLLVVGVALLAVSIQLLLWSIAYMERAMVATSLLSALAGFSLLSASLYVLRLAAYVYGVEAGES